MTAPLMVELLLVGLAAVAGVLALRAQTRGDGQGVCRWYAAANALLLVWVLVR